MGNLFLSPESVVEYAPRRGYDRVGVIYFPFRSYLMKKVRTWYELLHKALFSRAIKVFYLYSYGKKITPTLSLKEVW